jgi:uracil-DNA glycosylase family protein
VASSASPLSAAPRDERPARALRAIEQGARFEDVRDAADGCRACALWARATRTVFGEGPVPARLMLVGEQPGDREDLDGRPFVGPAGGILDVAIDAASLDRETTFVTNVVKHFKWRPVPGSKRRLHEKPNRTEVGACLPWVESELALVRPEALLLLGSTALRAFAGADASVMALRGRPLDLRLAPLVTATVHPSSILRAGPGRKDAFEAFVKDLKAVARWLEGRGA